MNIAFIVTVLIALLVLGLAVYIFDKAPIDPTIKAVGKAIALVIFLVWILLELQRLFA